MRSYVITASGTGIGKTLVTCALAWQLRERRKKVTALKPVMSGYHPDDPSSDAALILRSCGVVPTPALIEAISPWRWRAPLAPGMAAAVEGRAVDLDALLHYCREHAAQSPDALLVEAAGGVMTPLNGRHTVLDWAEGLGWPVIMVAGTYLGAISHALTALTALKARGVALAAVILSESETPAAGLDESAAWLEKFLPAAAPVVTIPRIAAMAEIWQHVPSLGGLVTPEIIGKHHE